MVVTMVLILLICRSPTIVLWVLWSFEWTIKIFFDSASSSFFRRFHNIANLIAIINAATNFLPFCVFGQLFRAECLNIYCCRKPINEPYLKYSSRKGDEQRPSKPPIKSASIINGDIENNPAHIEQCSKHPPVLTPLLESPK
jgi:hypothetical protein